MIFTKRFNIFLATFFIVGIFLAVTPEQKNRYEPPKDWMGSALVHEVTATELADWVMEGRKDFTIIDLRSGEKKSSLPNAEVMDKVTFFNDQTISLLGKDQKIIIVADLNDEAVKAARFLNYNKFTSFILTGGVHTWEQEVLNPIAPPDSDEASWANYKRRLAVANFLTGKNAEVFSTPPVTVPATGVPVMKKRSSGGGGGC